MNTFTPCKGKTACRDDGTNCTSCNRSLAEIEQTRRLIDSLAEFVCDHKYDNPDVFLAYVADKAAKKVASRAIKQ